jgi:hypothetical protein
MLSLEEGRFLIRFARAAVEKHFHKGKIVLEKNGKKILSKKRGVFVTIKTFPESNLRGCIGFPYPTLPLGEAIQRAAISSAFEDPRFPPIEKEELSKIVFEISVLTEPDLIPVKYPKEYLKKIKIGKDGLIIQSGPFSGLLLPQVPVEYKWGVQEFLDSLCMKAGLSPECLHDKTTKIWKFQAQIFSEEKPNGKL